MITVVRTVHCMPAKNLETIAVAKEICGIIKRVSGLDITVGLTIGGSISEIAWIGQYESYPRFEEMIAKVTADGEYRAAIKKIELLIVPSSGRDQIWRHI